MTWRFLTELVFVGSFSGVTCFCYFFVMLFFKITGTCQSFGNVWVFSFCCRLNFCCFQCSLFSFWCSFFCAFFIFLLQIRCYECWYGSCQLFCYGWVIIFSVGVRCRYRLTSSTSTIGCFILWVVFVSVGILVFAGFSKMTVNYQSFVVMVGIVWLLLCWWSLQGGKDACDISLVGYLIDLGLWTSFVMVKRSKDH